MVDPGCFDAPEEGEKNKICDQLLTILKEDREKCPSISGSEAHLAEVLQEAPAASLQAEIRAVEHQREQEL